MISVALCTFNGEKYLSTQITSILNQSMKVDEIVVCDDGSSDKTLDILNEIKKDSETTISIHINDHQLGVSKNFEKAINLCKGDVIFLSDQDDIWAKNKVETIYNWFAAHPEHDAVFTNAVVINADGEKAMDQTLWDCVGFNKSLQKSFANGLSLETFFLNRATGATMAFRKSLSFPFSQYCNQWKNILHDYCLALKALDGNKLGCINLPLISYRLHGNQQSGVDTRIPLPKKFSNILRPICNIPDEFPFEDKKTIFHAWMGKERALSGLNQCISDIFKYIKCYRHKFIRFYLYDIMYKIDMKRHQQL